MNTANVTYDRKTFVYAIILALLSVLLYANSFSNDFVWDSDMIFRQDPTIRDWKNIPDYFQEDLYAHESREGNTNQVLSYYRPLVKTVHCLEYQVFGPNPLGYNAVNIILNAVVVALGFLCALEITASRTVAFVAALLYAVNPSRVEAVSWACSDSYILSGLFSFLSLFLYLRRHYLFALASFVIALLCHESAILISVVLALYEYLYPHGAISLRVRRTAPFFGVAAIYLVVRHWVVGTLPLTSLDPVTLFNTVTVIIKRFVKIFFLPDAPITIYPLELFSRITPEVAISYGAALLLAGIALFLWLRRRDLLFWYLWFFVWISVIFNVGRVGEYLMADKSLYLASFGFCVLLAVVAVNVRRHTVVAVTLVSAFIAVHALMTFSHTRFWKNDVVYFEKALEFSPDFYAANYGLGMTYASKGEYEQAVLRFEKAVAKNPRHSHSHSNLGSAYYMVGDSSKAMTSWEKAIQADPSNPMPYYNMGMVLEERGQAAMALSYYRSFLSRERDPSPVVLGKIRLLEAAAGDKR